MRIIYRLTILSLFFTIFVLSCKNENLIYETTISLSGLIKAQPDSFSKETFLNIIKIYPAKKACNQYNQIEKYANLYICSKVSSGDTVYVFEECRKVNEIAFDTINSYPVVKNTNIVIQSPDKISIFVSSDFEIKKDVKYFYAKMDFYSEY
jgi:uncharacterized pyridoxamine 5'-phosphate oxidase family protein